MDRLARALLPSWFYGRLKASDLARRILRGSAWILVGSASHRILVLIGMILAARILGREDFGALGLIQATLGVIGLLAGIGLGNTAIRFVAEHAKSDPARAGRIIGLVFVFSGVAIVGASAALVFGADFIAGTIFAAPGLDEGLVWGALFMAALALRGVQNGIWVALERFDTLAKLNALEGALSLALLLALASALGLVGAFIALALSAGAAWSIGHVFLLRELRSRGLVVRLRGAWSERRILFGYALPQLLTGVVTMPALWFAMTLVARDEAGLAGLGLYNAAYQWHGPVTFMPLMIGAVAIPPLVQAWHEGRTAQFRTIARSMYGVALASTLPIAIVGSLASPLIMRLYGPTFGDGWLMLVLLLIAAPFAAVGRVAANSLLARDRPLVVLTVNVGWGVIVVGLTIALLPSTGAFALAVGFLAAHAFSSLLMAKVALPRRANRSGGTGAKGTDHGLATSANG